LSILSIKSKAQKTPQLTCVTGISIGLNYLGKHKRKMTTQSMKLTRKQPAARAYLTRSLYWY